jgi:hypothetical protein
MTSTVRQRACSARVTFVLASAAALASALPVQAAETKAKSVTCQKSCKIELKLVGGKPAVLDDPIVIARGKTKVHVNWHAPKGWEFVEDGAALKQSAAGEFAQWCASDVDDDSCTTRKPKGRKYHCLALNNNAGNFEYRLRLREISTGEVHEIDPTIVNQGR